MAETGNTDGQIATNLRLLVLVEVVAEAGVPLVPSVINERLGLPKPTLHRLLATAEAEGLLQRDIDGRSFGPGPRLRSLAVATLSSSRIRAVRIAILKALSDKVGETCNLAIPDREGMIYLDRVETQWPLRIQLPVGTQVPFHCTASGKMYLSSLRKDYLDRFLKHSPLTAATGRTITQAPDLRRALDVIRSRGYATDDEEFMDGMVAVAVPVLDSRQRLISTLSIHAPVQRHSVAALEAYLDPLRSAAADLSACMEGA